MSFTKEDNLLSIWTITSMVYFINIVRAFFDLLHVNPFRYREV